MKNLREDIQVNHGVLSKLVMVAYRYGHYVFYHVKVPVIRQFLWLLYRAFELLVRILTHAELPATCHIGKGLRLDHGGNGVVIHPNAKIGEYVRMFHQVTIGINSFAPEENYGPPTVGNRVYIGCGVKIIGKVTVGENVRIGANAVVTKDIPSNCTAVGIPAKVITSIERGSA